MAKAVGIRQLKARLSEYLRLVRGGETILVTDRDEVVAELRPARAGRTPSEDLLTLLDSLADAGIVTLPSLPKAGWTWQPKSLGLEPAAVADILDDLRSDR